MRWPPNPWPSGNCLTSELPELLWVSGCFQLRPCRAHIPATSLRCVSWGDGPATPFLQIFLLCTRNRTQKGGSKLRQLMPDHRLCDKDPSHLKALIITFFWCPYLWSRWLLYLQLPPLSSGRVDTTTSLLAWFLRYFADAESIALGWYTVDLVLVISTLGTILPVADNFSSAHLR